MDMPYRQYGYLFLNDELLDELSSTDDYEERKNIFIDHISTIDSPYELHGFIFDGEFKDYFDDAESLMLDYLVEEKKKWDADELICFFLEVATNHIRLTDNPSWLAVGHREIQIPTAWSDNSITIKINQGSFQAGDTAYLFVVDEEGNVSYGYPVVIDGRSDENGNVIPSNLNASDGGGGGCFVNAINIGHGFLQRIL